MKFFLATTVLLIILVLFSGDSWSWGSKAPSPEIVAATQKALSQRLFESESEDWEEPDDEETRFVVMYAFSPDSEKCELCIKDIQDMFGTLLFNSEQVKQKKISVWMMTEAEVKITSEYLTNILAPLFAAKKIEPEKIDAYIKSIYLLVECKSDFAEVEGAQLPIIGIIDSTREDEENSGQIYISAGALGPWSKFDQIILKALE